MSIYLLKVKGHHTLTQNFSNPFYGREIKTLGYYSSFRKAWATSFDFVDEQGHKKVVAYKRGHHKQNKSDKEIRDELKKGNASSFVRSINEHIKFEFHISKYELDKPFLPEKMQ